MRRQTRKRSGSGRAGSDTSAMRPANADPWASADTTTGTSTAGTPATTPFGQRSRGADDKEHCHQDR